MSISAVGSLAHSMMPGQSAHPVDPAYGLAFRFTVQIDGMNFGSWQSCSGLKVDYKPVEMRAGGAYTGSQYLPGELVYPKVVLKRAAAARESEEVQNWLQRNAEKWVMGGVNDPDGEGGTIVLYDHNDQPVMWWQLRGVRPAAWSGPDLDANTSKVAVETLELVHSGFTVGTGKPTKAAASSDARATKLVLSGQGRQVVFDYPPTEIVLQKNQGRGGTGQAIAATPSQAAVSGQAAQVHGETPDMYGDRPNQSTYKLANLILHGDQTSSNVELLNVWATRTSTDPTDMDSLPPLDFSWGAFGGENSGPVPVRLTALTATYVRFSSDGKPVRAKVGLTLEVRVPPATSGSGAATAHPGSGNPSSGGIPGRAAHVMLETDTLPGLAQRTYGKANRWRAIADANGIDDPLRVRPGTSLLLPAPQEVGR